MVGGVDTHRDNHVAAVVDTTGRLLGTASFSATGAGYGQFLGWMRGVGPEAAATLLIAAGDNPERMRNESAFASLCGASPIEASSGRTVRHRLNRGGDRQANNALWRIAMVRLRHDERTIAYAQRRTAEGKTAERSPTASNATSPAKSTGCSPTRPKYPKVQNCASYDTLLCRGATESTC